MDLIGKWSSFLPEKSLSFKLGKSDLTFSYWQLALIALLVFLLFLSLARVRRMFLHWSLGKHSLSFFFWGFVLALILEGILVLVGRTAFTESAGKSLPKPVAGLVETVGEQLTKVLGESTQVEITKAGGVESTESFIKAFLNLPSDQKKQIKEEICRPD